MKKKVLGVHLVMTAAILFQRGCSAFTSIASSASRRANLPVNSRIQFYQRQSLRIVGAPSCAPARQSCDGGRTIHRSFSSGNSKLYVSMSSNRQAQSTKKSNKKKPGMFRADRVLSNRGWASRSECFALLKQKRVFLRVENTDPSSSEEKSLRRINGPSEKIPMNASLWVDGKVEVAPPPPLLRVYHKPKWVLSVMSDPHGRKTLADLDFINHMHPVGRLDYDTSGLLLFSSEGSLTQTLLHPSNEIQKEYVATVTGNVNEEELREKLAQGVSTSLGAFPAQLVNTKPIPTDEIAPLVKSVLDNLPPEYNQTKLEEKGYLFFADAKELTQVRLIVEEGKHRMVRKILANSGHPVVILKRERLGVVELGDLEEGGYRDLTSEETKWAEKLLKQRRGKKKAMASSPATRKEEEDGGDAHVLEG